MHYPRKIVIRKRLSVRVRVMVVNKVKVWLGLGLGLHPVLTDTLESYGFGRTASLLSEAPK